MRPVVTDYEPALAFNKGSGQNGLITPVQVLFGRSIKKSMSGNSEWTDASTAPHAVNEPPIKGGNDACDAFVRVIG